MAFNLYGQVAPLEDYTWYLEKLILNGTTSHTPQGYTVTSEFWNSLNFDYDGCSDLYANISYGNNQTFSISSGSIGDQICNNPLDPFDLLYIEDFIQWDTFVNPYSYTFTNQSNLIILTIINANGDQAIYQNQQLSIADNVQVSKIVFYPNPVKDFLIIQSPDVELEKIEVYDVQGKQVKSFSKDLEKIDMQAFDNGIYFLKIYGEQGMSLKKIVKK